MGLITEKELEHLRGLYALALGAEAEACRCKMEIGDYIIKLITQRRATISTISREIAQGIGMSPGSVRQYYWVSCIFTPTHDLRTWALSPHNSLSWCHLRELTKRELTEDDRKRWALLCMEKGLTVSALVKLMNPPAQTARLKQGLAFTCGCCGEKHHRGVGSVALVEDGTDPIWYCGKECLANLLIKDAKLVVYTKQAA